MIFFNLIGAWLLFAFPLYQAFLELSLQAIEFTNTISNELLSKKISPWWWLLPPIKIHKEKQRSIKIIRSIGLSQKTLHELWLFLDKATAWFYVSLAGLLNALSVTYELYLSYKYINNARLIFSLITLLLLFISIGNTAYRLSDSRIQKKIDFLSKKTN